MGSSTVFFGYPGQVWATCFAAMQTLQQQLASQPTGIASEGIALATFETLINGLSAINAWSYQRAWQTEALNIGAVQALPFSLDPGASLYLSARSKALTLATVALGEIIPAPSSFGLPFQILAQGSPAIPDPGLIEFYQNFEFENPPPGLTAANLISSAQAAADAFGKLASGVQVGQGIYLTQAYDACLRLQETQQIVVDALDSTTSGPFLTSAFVSGNPSGLWNQIVVLPALLSDAAILSTTPYLLSTQQLCVIRNAIITVAQQVALFLIILRRPQATQINLATVNQGQNLLDIAATELGDFEQWAAIADANSLLPPYISTTPGSGVATPGQNLLMPTGGVSPSPIGTPPTIDTILGVDIYPGPINEPMLPWTGDFQTIAGYNNLQWALGRRLQTALGSLIYHPDYGSRIPGQIGSPQVSTELQLIASFGKSALQADPRVASVLSTTVTAGANNSISFTGVVLPQGSGPKPLTISVTLPQAA